MKFLLKYRTAAIILMTVAMLVLTQAALGGVARAQCAHPDSTTGLCPAPTDVINNTKDLIAKVNLIINILFTALLLLAVVFIILAAFSYLTAGGDAEKVKKASHRVLYAAVAVAVAVLARAVPAVVQNFLGPGTATTP